MGFGFFMKLHSYKWKTLTCQVRSYLWTAWLASGCRPERWEVYECKLPRVRDPSGSEGEGCMTGGGGRLSVFGKGMGSRCGRSGGFWWAWGCGKSRVGMAVDMGWGRVNGEGW